MDIDPQLSVFPAKLLPLSYLIKHILSIQAIISGRERERERTD